jgi:uncharacterized membrane protein YdjX (TVP38/TMEM64 family)
MKCYLPLVAIIMLIAVAYSSGISHYLTKGNFEHIHHAAIDYVEEHPYISPLIFMAIYIAYASLALPGIVLLTILGGFIFPQPLSTLYVVSSATLGGSILFLSTCRAARNILSKEETRNNQIKIIEKFQQNAASYLLCLRLVPLFPYWSITVVSALLKVRFSTFFWTTFIGITPCAFFLTQMGASMMLMMEADGTWTWNSFLLHLHHL